mmetsp:Transcript_11936/g.28264  ORF Transcript_11936/g.28264 Transcript_11936/m.28264 type:complete len:215 (+) Transcript_11936:703-1347(+)
MVLLEQVQAADANPQAGAADAAPTGPGAPSWPRSDGEGKGVSGQKDERKRFRNLPGQSLQANPAERPSHLLEVSAARLLQLWPAALQLSDLEVPTGAAPGRCALGEPSHLLRSQAGAVLRGLRSAADLHAGAGGPAFHLLRVERLHLGASARIRRLERQGRGEARGEPSGEGGMVAILVRAAAHNGAFVHQLLAAAVPDQRNLSLSAQPHPVQG